METKPFDRSLLIPIVIGGLALLGIVVVLMFLRLEAARPAPPATESPTPVRYQYLGTEPVVAFPTFANTPTESSTTPEAEQTPTALILLPRTPTDSDFEFAPTATATPPARPGGSATPTVEGLRAIYDDVDPALDYTGNWIAQSGVSGTYKLTLHISSTIGDSVTLTFFGQQVRLVYQAGQSLGQVAIRLDNQDFTLDQSAPVTSRGEWESPIMAFANHTITVTHITGGAINIDAFEIIDLGTSTPTSTPTFTPTLTVTP
jgi:hypothetical protein